MRPLKGFEGRYEISESGSVWSLPGHPTDGRKRSREIWPRVIKGKSYLFLRDEEGNYVRRPLAEVVLEAFVAPKPRANSRPGHRDGDVLNTRPDNLFWLEQEDLQSANSFPDDLLGEEWRPVVDAGGFYEVSNLGRVRGVPRLDSMGRMVPSKILKTSVGSSGYQQVGLKSKASGLATTKMVHRLVGEAFLGPMPEGFGTRHLDGDKMNNAASNLLYGTYSENSLDILRHGRHPSQRTNLCPRGHVRAGNNAVRKSKTTEGSGACRACGNAKSWLRTHPGEDMQEVSDRYFEKIMRDDFSPGATMPPERLRQLTNLVEDGVSFNEIQRTMGCSYKTVKRYFPDYLPFPRGGAGAASAVREANRMLRELDRTGRVQQNRDSGMRPRRDVL